MKRNKVCTTNSEVMDNVHQHYPNAKQVPVCMGKTISTIYEDETYTKQIAEVLYEYTTRGAMFGYDYKLVYL